MVKKTNYKMPKQIVGNIGLYYVCYELSKRGWNVLPTSRNAKGVDLIIYSQDATRTHIIQVKSLSGRDAVSIGNNTNNLIGDFMVICRKVTNSNIFLFIYLEKSGLKKPDKSNDEKDCQNDKY